MGFFKKIGQSIKKNVSFKNLVKVATTAVGFVPGVGVIAQNVMGKITDAVETKKMAKEAEAQGKQAEADYWNAQTEALKQSTANTVGAVAGSGANIFGKAVMSGVNDGLSTGLVQGSGQLGATVLSSTIKIWFQRNWKIVIGAVVGLIALIWFIRRDRNNSGKRVAKRK
ncbi:hypothetical protein OIU80_19120 [Flavobacterium sp. LS1R47]|uniref:Uncharacterized protein n=1 Tax=Flavobacterium frigoritolerans TaxID=2987686 RepID=A0A9X3CA37_9FLAO|nr:hypothetical protein [Flavobacterium frigoritolerans]MCV9934396.1 hypothetical protein [Flavobacterium frigoritolerans]